MAWLEPGPKEDNEDSLTKALVQAIAVDDIDVNRMLQMHGNQFHNKGSQAEVWIQQPPHDMWSYERGQGLIAQLGDATKPSENKYYTALLIFKDVIEQTEELSTMSSTIKFGLQDDKAPRLSSDLQEVSNPAKWYSSVTTASSTVKDPREMTIEELTKENERLKQINLEMKNKQLQQENEKLKQKLEESNRMGGSWSQVPCSASPRPPAVLAVVSCSELISKCLALAGAHTAGTTSCASHSLKCVASSEDVWQPLFSAQWPGCQWLVGDSVKSRDLFARMVAAIRKIKAKVDSLKVERGQRFSVGGVDGELEVDEDTDDVKVIIHTRLSDDDGDDYWSRTEYVYKQEADEVEELGLALPTSSREEFEKSLL